MIQYAFHLRCLDFYIEGAAQIQKRFGLSDPVMKNLGAMDPKSVFNKSVPSVAPLVSFFPRLSSSEKLNEIESGA